MGFILNLLLGGGLKAITGALGEAHARKLAAQTSEAKLEADMEIVKLTAQRDILIAEVGAGGFKSWIRPMFALIVMSYLFKAIMWDKVVCSFAGWDCSTDPLGETFTAVMMLVLGSYFIGRSAEKIMLRRR